MQNGQTNIRDEAGQQRVQAARAKLNALEDADAPWPKVRKAKREYFTILQRSALAIRKSRWRERASADDNTDKIEKLAKIMREVRERNEATARGDDYYSMAESIEAAIAAEIAESNYEIAVAKSREFFGRQTDD